MWIPEQSAAGSAVPAPAPPTLWKNRNFLLVLSGYTLSTFGNCFHSIAIGLWMLQETGSARYLSAVTLLYTLTALLFGAFAGTVADRGDRKRLMWLCDFIRAALVACIALCIAIGTVPVAVILALTAAVAFAGLFQQPALQASIMDITTAEHVQKAVGAMQFADNAARITGLAAGGAFVALFGGYAAILIDAGTFLSSALLVLACGRFGRPASGGGASYRKTSFLQDLKAGLSYVWQDRLIRGIVLLAPALGMFFLTSLMLIQVTAVKVWAAPPLAFGMIEACIPLGYLVGAGVLLLIEKSLRHRGRIICIGMLSLGPIVVAISQLHSAWHAIPLILLLGGMFSLSSLLLSIILRLKTPAELQGRVFSVLGSLSGALPPLGLTVASFEADLRGPQLPLLITGLSLLAFGSTVACFHRTLRRLP